MSEFFWDAYKRSIRERIRKHSEYLTSGKAKDFAEYRNICGKLAGLEESLVQLKDCLKKAGMEEDYADE